MDAKCFGHLGTCWYEKSQYCWGVSAKIGSTERIMMSWLVLWHTGMQVAARLRDQDAAWPSQAQAGQLIKLPRQTRVTAEEYREFLVLGHGEIFVLDLDRVTEAPWRLPTSDISEYFNYGLTERTWREYQRKIARYRAEFFSKEDIVVLDPDGDGELNALPAEVVDAILELRSKVMLQPAWCVVTCIVAECDLCGTSALGLHVRAYKSSCVHIL